MNVGGNIIIGGSGGVHIRGSVGGSVVVGGGEVIINGRRITADTQGAQSLEPVRKQVVLKVKPEKELSYDLSNSAGDIELPRGQGSARLFSRSGRIRVGEFDGNLRTESKSGNVTVQKLNGELAGNLTSGDVMIGSLNGEVNLHATSGDITIRELALAGRSNRINATSGDMRLGISNEQVKFSAESNSGDIDVDRGKYTITKEKKAKRGGMTVIQSGNSIISIGGGGGGGYMEGFRGSDGKEVPELSVSATSGDISIS